ncbi:peptidoglycan-binding protein [Streptomyces halobius]|uniref:Peptidoglycan-binding protein n=1 Tax=Streptomyces halobius TaxID=2879846 RepID=A0ABY4M6V3_9ACTN|nr:peptidoglycan-binding protein [Streptomyces halobius]UQA93500.1 peptidoglycan-binding protein [Streptomyces halobius]
MSRWKELPGSLDQRVRQLVVQLRRLKDHSGLSLASLAVKTSYSKSSWERYLNGRKLPPRDAVESLARVCGADTARLLALHEVAAQAWEAQRPEAEAPPEERTEQPDEGAVAGRREVWAGPLGLAALGVLAGLIVAGAVLLVVRPWQDDTGTGRGAGVTAAGRAPNASPTFSHRPGETYSCHIQRKEGALYAGRSRTRTAILGNGMAGWQVVEAQCLLHHQGYDPGPVDGIVGENTMRAVKRLQAKAGLPADGIVGPDTWKVLRR